MKGAVVAIVARPPRPFFMSAVVIMVARSIARSAAATVSCPCAEAPCASYANSRRPAETTFATWLSLYFFARSIASLSLSCFRSWPTSRANLTDCCFAFWNVMQPLDRDGERVDRKQAEQDEDPLDEGPLIVLHRPIRLISIEIVLLYLANFVLF